MEKEHGGLFRLAELPDTPEILPYKKGNIIHITDTGSNSKSFHKKYIKKLNSLILKSGDNLSLDFRGCFGGKPQVMAAGLSPLFFRDGVLSYWYDARRHRDIVIKDGVVICHSNNNAVSIGTTKKKSFSHVDVFFNSQTSSAAEQVIICLIGSASIGSESIGSASIGPRINLIGARSAGYTTVNKYFELPLGYGIEIPIGHMGTRDHVFHNGVIRRELL